MKYVKFSFTTGYVGTDIRELASFPDDATEEYIRQCFNDWYDEKRMDSGNWAMATEEDIESGVDIEY